HWLNTSVCIVLLMHLPEFRGGYISIGFLARFILNSVGILVFLQLVDNICTIQESWSHYPILRMFDPVGFITDYTVFFHRRDELYCMQVMMIKRIRFRVNNENINPYFSPSSFIKCVALSNTNETVEMFWAIICDFFRRNNGLFKITYSH